MVQMNEYFMKYCNEESSKNCKSTQCQYRLNCSRFKYLQTREKENGTDKCKSL